MERIKPESYKYRVVSLFAGIGGFDLGFEYAGFNIIWANDFDKFAVQTYKENVNHNIVLGDIVEEKHNIPEHDVLIAGFPCQPFSTLGNLKGFDDERGTLFFEIEEILKKHKTKVAVLENVRNILSHDKGRTFKKMVHKLEALGYAVYHTVLNSADYGVPQRRNRAFIFAFLREAFDVVEPTYPNPITLTVTTQDLLDEEVDNKYFLSKKITPTIMGTGTKNYIVKPTIDMPISKTLTATMHKMHRASQDNYVTDHKNFERFNDPNKNPIRRLTPNECRKLQGFPSDWNQVVSDTQAYRQFGNAVTVNVSYAIAKMLFEYMETNLKVID